MSHIVSRVYSGASDLNLLIEFARNAAGARWPRSTYKKVGDMVWGTSGIATNLGVRLWFDGADLVAYGWFEPPDSIEFDIKPGLTEYDAVGGGILEWAERRTRELAMAGSRNIPKAYAMLGYDETILLTQALDSDHQRIELLQQHGYKRSEGFSVLYRRSLSEPATSPTLERGLLLRHATDADLEARVDVHRDAWSVWGPSGATVENYRRLRAAPIYDPELDVVLDDRTGRLIAYCIGWLDVANGFGHFEPVGCRPACTRRGYARVVTIEAMRRMRARGMHTALVETAGVNEGARRLYSSCGFVEVERAHHYTRSVTQIRESGLSD